MTPDQLAAAIRHAVVTAIADGAVVPRARAGPGRGHRRASPQPRARRLRHQRRAAAGQDGGHEPARPSPRLVAERLRARRGRRHASTSPVPASSTSASTPRRSASSRAPSSSRARRTAGSTGTPASTSTSSSSRPTRPGPLHLGHTRWAAVGDALAPRARGGRAPRSTREFYVNDRGVQMDRFGQSLEARGARQPRCPRTATRARTSTTSPQQIVAADPGIVDLARRRAAGGVPRGGRTPCSSQQQKDTLDGFGTALRRLVLRAHAARQRRGRAGPRQAARARATCTRPTARCGCAPPTSATTRTASSSRATASSTYFAERHGVLRRQAGARLRRLHLPARRRPPRLRQPAAGGRGLRRRRPRPQHRGAHRPDGQAVQGRRGGPALQAGRQHHHARGPRRRGRRRRGALLADPLPGRQPARPSTSTCSCRAATTTRSSTCSTRTPGSPRCCATPPTSGSTGAPPTSTRRCSTHEREGALLGLIGELPRVVATAAELREPHRVARYLEELANGYHQFYDVVPGAAAGRRARSSRSTSPGSGCAAPPGRSSPTVSRCSVSARPERM